SVPRSPGARADPLPAVAWHPRASPGAPPSSSRLPPSLSPSSSEFHVQDAALAAASLAEPRPLARLLSFTRARAIACGVGKPHLRKRGLACFRPVLRFRESALAHCFVVALSVHKR